LDLTFQKRFTK